MNESLKTRNEWRNYIERFSDDRSFIFRYMSSGGVLGKKAMLKQLETFSEAVFKSVEFEISVID